MKNAEKIFYSPTPFEKPIRPIILVREPVSDRIQFLAKPKKIFT